MIKSIFATSIFVIALLFNGCGESDAESQLEVQQKLDDKDYTGVIAKLEGTATSDADFIALAAAYMGASGLSLADLIIIIANSSDQTDAFASFIESLKAQINSNSLSYLKKASDDYEVVLNGVCEDSTATLTDSQKDICLYKGLALSMKATASISYLVGNISILTESGSADDQLSASLCAMRYAFDANTTGCVITDTNTSVTFVESNTTFTPISAKSSTATDTFDFLISGTTAGTTAITSGYCPLTSFASRDTTMTYDAHTSGYYICPVDESGDQNLTTTALLVEALNGGFDSIIASVGGVTSDMSTDIAKFKSEINTDGNATITISEITTYLNNLNN